MFGRNKKRERVLIIGLGEVGYFLAKRLQHEEYLVTAIEQDPVRLRYADETLDIRQIRGEAMDLGCWKEADAGSMSCVIAVTDNDAVNMMAARIAEKFGVASKIARVRSLQFGQDDSLLSREDLQVDLLIHPEELAAQEIVRLIRRRNANEVIDIAGGEVQLFATRVTEDSGFANKKMVDISREYDTFVFRVVAVARGITTIIPSGDMEILPNDHIFAMVGRSCLPELMEITGVGQKIRQRLMILGGGLVGKRVAELLQSKVEVKLIEIDENRAAELSHELPSVEVLHGDGSNAETLTMAGVKDIDTFIAATGDNETNIMSSLLAKNLMQRDSAAGNHREKTIALVKKEDYLVLAATIGLDIALNWKILAANEILKHIRRDELISVGHLHGFDAEVVELVAAPKSPITRKPLSKLDPIHQGNILIGAVHRDGAWIVAVGNTHIRDNERVIVVCLSMQLNAVRKLFSV
ncbi:MAG: Trk system potassium transporter TrkA [Desulfobacterales bacterium]|nr:MAG: Trk system potassium transporter TrkA [Desulfobacterales bacterium]